MAKDPSKNDPKNPPPIEKVEQKAPEKPSTPTSNLPPPVSQEEIQVLMQALRQVKRPLATAPTATPKNLLQQFELYDDGVNQRVYFWVAGTWRYAALT